MGQALAATAFVQSYFDLWLKHFPELGKRGHWDVATKLCVEGRRGGARFSMLHGVCRGRYGTDETTLRQRMAEMVAAGLCLADPAGTAIGARTVFTATTSLGQRFDLHGREANRLLWESAVSLGEELPAPSFEIVSDRERAAALAVVQRFAALSEAALESFFAELTVGAGAARIAQLQQRIRSIPHGTLLRLLLSRAVASLPEDAPGVAADELAFKLFERTGQGAETTRDHLPDLMRLGVVERAPAPRGSRLLFARLAPRALPFLHDAAEVAGRDLRHTARAVWRDPDETIKLVRMRRPAAGSATRPER